MANARINEFTAWEEFVKAWGWDVVETGPGDDTSAPEDQFEICVPANGDVCKAGAAGAGAGQFGPLAGPQGVAVDSSGGVYVVDRDNFRVQKFDPEGHFLLMFGGQVNKTKVEGAAPEGEQNLCTAASGDACQAGVEGPGNGKFGAWPLLGSFIAIDPTDNVYVGDANRIQRFNTAGAYQGEIAVPGETIQTLASDAAGNLYAAYLSGGIFSGTSKPDVRKLSPAGAPLKTFEVASPRAVAVDVVGNVFAFDQDAIHENDPAKDRPPILEFDSSGDLVAEFGKGEFTTSTGLATNFCAGSDQPGNVYATNADFNQSFLRAYGTPPVGCEPPPPHIPEIEDQYAVFAGTDSALVRALINPRFMADTTFYVEYGTGNCATGGCDQRIPPTTDTPLGGGITQDGVLTSGVVLTGLAPGTTYHYRFVAESEGGGPEFGLRPTGAEGDATFVAGLDASFTAAAPLAPLNEDCENQPLRTGASAFLPDCRAFEMVSPVDKNGGGIETLRTGGTASLPAAHDQSSASGDGITYSAKQAFGDALGSPYSSQYLSSRDEETGWSTHSVNAPHEGFPGSASRAALDVEYVHFSLDLSEAWMIHQAEPPLAPCAPEESSVLYWRDNTDDGYEALHCEPNIPFANAGSTIELLGVSDDGCQAVFRSNTRLTDDAAPLDPGLEPLQQPYQLYESNCEGPVHPEGPLRLISVLPNGEACKAGSSAGSLFEDGANGGRGKNVWHAFSVDAHRLYWSCGKADYLRTDPDLAAEGEPGEESIAVLGPTSGIGPQFQAASPDGSRALFTSFNAGSDSYRLQAYDATSPGPPVTIAEGVEDIAGKRTSLLGASEDATRAYFVSTKVLSDDPNSEGKEAIEGKQNLYLHEDGAGFRFIGALAPQNLKDEPTPTSVSERPYDRAARVSPDGLHAAFVTSAPLTGFDNTDVNSGEADLEVFVYDATANDGEGELLCVSCNPTGVRPAGRDILLARTLWAAASIPGWQSQLYQGHPLSADGRRLFFNSFEALVIRDTNHRQDVYEWEQVNGVGKAAEKECKEIGAELYIESADGCISLISSGQDPFDSEFIDADPDGSDVFIRTGESLLVQDPGLVDVYDARINGGFPPPAGIKPPCEGEACQSPPAPPSLGTPASSAFMGPEDPKPHKARKCPKGKRKVRRAGKTRCVAKHKHIRHHKRGQRRANSNHGRAAR